LHDEDPRAGPRAGCTSRPSGLATQCLVQAIHDLRGPLNTISILLEVLRTSALADAAPHRDALASATNSVQALDGMLRRLRGVTDTLAVELRPVPLAPALATAIARAGDREPRVALTATPPPALAATTCAERLPAMLDQLLACGRAALPNGGALQLAARATAPGAVIELTGAGADAELPTPHSLAQLTVAAPGPGDWFALSCLVAGLGGDIELATATGQFSVCVRLPRPTSPSAAGNPTC
jgi:signal transduction histidine kinase